MDADEFIAAARERLADLIAPINGGAGADVSYEASFEAMKAEVDKTQSLEGGKVDWEAVASNATEILESQSKDFRAILYYAAAKSKTAGVAGLFDGLVVLAGLIETLWEPMYPALKRPRARGNLCPFLGDAAAPTVDAWNPGQNERIFAIAFEKTFRGVDNELADKLGDAYPGMGNLRDSVRRLAQRIPAEAAPPPPPPPPPEPKAAPAPGDAAPVSVRPPPSTSSSSSYEAAPASAGGGGGGGYSVNDIVDEDSALRVLQEIVPILQRAGEVLRSIDPASPEGLRLNRVASTLFLNASIGQPGAQTQVNAPDDDTVNTAMALFDAGDWQPLANLMESVLTANPVWLDGFFYAAHAYENLEKPVAQKVVESEAIALVKRSANIEQLLFNSGMAFANDATKAWLAGLAGPGGGGGAPGGDKDPVGKAVARSQELIAAGDAPGAIAAVEKAAKTATTAVVRFRAKLKAAETALAVGYPDLARAQLDGLDRVAQTHHLEEWDPELVVQLYALLYRCQAGLGYFQSENPEQRARVASTWERLCQLDGALALRTLLELG